MSLDKPDVTAQVRFGENGLEKDEHVETGLDDWGLVENEVERETKIEQEQASKFGKDDRTKVEQDSQTKQSNLVRIEIKDQETLTGKQAVRRPEYE